MNMIWSRYVFFDKAKQNNTLVSGIPPILAKWGRPTFYAQTKQKLNNKKFKFFNQLTM